jgi:Holliday junction resolvase RusA-like endonuclease
VANQPRRVTIIIPGEAQTKSNKTYFRRGRVYIPSKIAEWERWVGQIALEAMRGREPFTCPVSVQFKMYRGSKRKCDLGNYQKSAMDALNGVVFEDDYLICHLNMYKLYDKENPRLEIVVTKCKLPAGEKEFPIVLPEDRAKPKKKRATRKRRRKKK